MVRSPVGRPRAEAALELLFVIVLVVTTPTNPVLTMALLLACSGCSLNDFGIPGTVTRTVSNQPGARLVRIRAVGFHLYTTAAVGVHVGTIDRLLTYPVASSSEGAPDCVSLALDKFGDVAESTVSSESSGPVALEVRRIGGGMQWAPWAVSFGLGASRARVARFDGSSALTFFYDDRGPGAPRVCAVAPAGKGSSQ